MTWYYRYRGPHVRIRVYMNGAYNGELVFLINEFEELKRRAIAASPSSPIYSFQDKTAEDDDYTPGT